MPFISSGTLRYSPKLVGNRDEKWWLILDCDPEIGRYFRHLYYLDRYRTESLIRPSWAEHITLVRNEEPADAGKSLWGARDGESIDFDLGSPVETDGIYYWFPVLCQVGWQIRRELGLPEQPQVAFHLTIGHNGKME